MLDKDIIKKVAELGRKFSDTTIAMHEAIARQAGLAGTDHKYLSIIMTAGQMTAGEFSKASGLTTGAATAAIDRLEKKNLVRREFVKNDRRKVIIVADTKNAGKLLEASSKLLKEKILGLMETRTKAEIEIIEKYLQDTIQVMNEVTAIIGDQKNEII